MTANEEPVNQLEQIEPETTNRISWKTVAIVSLVVSGLLFLIILTLIAKRPVEIAMPDTQQDAVTIQNSYFDDNCSVQIVLSNSQNFAIPTDHQYSDKSIDCSQSKYIKTSPDTKYVVFEGSKWGEGPYSFGNYLGVYSADKNDYFIITSYGAAQVKKVTFAPQDDLYYEIAYEGDPFVLSDTFSLKNAVKNFDLNVNPTTKEYIPYNTEDGSKNTSEPVMGSLGEKVTALGVIKKEQIPADLELGEYWYWFYFDKPFLLENNSYGYPMMINKIQIVAGTNYKNADEKLDEYLDKKLEINGELSWGYAESRIIVLDSFEQMK
ncbi:hypothetical protein A2713_02220 [candidate division WWE3 bacterium RIFCSPHIGHO2_01_FULL_35_17]|uniref:Uncharacterized protein n=1 Tax=candidate division WWE3 bacterium RIFCSPHIGHO2_01_FULL_35_17 TaxID=1802614 RepID=A0A1F4UP78_UNCKA|nr:MAG: hypothetical protein A2713_02220 [candidate division WWE3 bacterium RIFCSPHIGHO2_01_FULL_35_17]